MSELHLFPSLTRLLPSIVIAVQINWHPALLV
jgi:hypothetical protein